MLNRLRNSLNLRNFKKKEHRYRIYFFQREVVCVWNIRRDGNRKAEFGWW